MNRFAALLDRLAYEPRRNAKIRIIADYFRHTPDPERGWALAAMTGSLSFSNAKPGLIRGLIAERTDPLLFGLSWDYVGDLSETVALMWPASPSPEGRAESRSDRRGDGADMGLAELETRLHDAEAHDATGSPLEMPPERSRPHPARAMPES